MKVLFVSSGNSVNGINPIIQNQANSLITKGVSVEHFVIQNKGFSGYLKNIIKLRKFLKKKKYDLIHAHYSFSGFVVSLTFNKTPIIVSLMGSDVFYSKLSLYIIRFFNTFFWHECIVKNEEMKNNIGDKKVIVLPNGVDIQKFKPLDKSVSQKYLNWNQSKVHLFFCSQPKRYEKNYKLVESALKLIKEEIDFEIHFAEGINNNEINYYYNASDVVLLSSLWEGSPNAIKEAMACNRPIVSTQVGDIGELFTDTIGCFIAQFNPEDYSRKIRTALRFGERNITNGRNRIMELGLDSKNISFKLINLYRVISK